MFFGVSCVVLIFAAIAGGFGLSTLTRIRSMNQSENAFKRLVQNEQWDEALDFLDNLDGQAAENPAFVKGRQTVNAALQQEADREREFKKIAREIDTQLTSGRSADIDFDQVKRLNELAKTDSELQTASEITGRAEEVRLRAEAAKTDDQTSQFESLQRSVEQFFATASDIENEPQRQSQRRELTKSLNEFIAQHHLSNPELVDVARQSVALLSQQGSRDQRDAKRAGMIAAVTIAVGDTKRFRRNVQEFVDDFPDDPMATQLIDNVLQSDVVGETETWMKVLSHRGFQDVNADVAQVQDWMQLVDANDQTSSHPFAKVVQPYRAYFATVLKRKGLIKQLREAFAAKLMAPMYAYPDPKGKVFYSDQDPKNNSDSAHVVPYFTDMNLTRDTKNFGLRYREDIVPNVRLAGHCRFAQSVARPVASASANDFTPTMYRLIKELRDFRGEPEMDPLFRGQWMIRLLKIAGEGSVPIREAFADWEQQLTDAKVDWNTNWIDPNGDQTELAKARQAATEALNAAGNWESRVQKMSANFKKWRQPRPPSPRWIGWVARQNDQYVAMLAAPSGKQTLYALVTDDHTKEVSMVPIETTINPESAGAEIVISNPAGQVCGAMICIVPTSKPPNSQNRT